MTTEVRHAMLLSLHFMKRRVRVRSSSCCRSCNATYLRNAVVGNNVSLPAITIFFEAV